MLIGEGPADEEARLGRPFVGWTGQQLDEVLLQHGIARTRVFILNATACPVVGKKNAHDMAEAVKCCHPYFRAQIQPYLDAHVPTLAMGKEAWRALRLIDKKQIPKGGMERGRGFIRSTENGTRYIATWHPTYAFFRNPFEWGAFEVDLRKFWRLMNDKLRPAPRLITNATERDIQALVRSATVQRHPLLPDEQNLLPIGIDLEAGPRDPSKPWTALNPHLAVIRTIGLANAEVGLSLRWATAPLRVKQAVQQVLAHPKLILVDQNGDWYDWPMMRRHGFRIPPVQRRFSIRDARHALVPQSPLWLGYMTTLYDDPPPWKSDFEEDDKEMFFTDDWDALQTVNAQDAVAQCRVSGPGSYWPGIRGEEEWSEPRVQQLYNLNRTKSMQAAKMYEVGIEIDEVERRRLASELAIEREKRLKKLLKIVGLPAFRGTPDDMRALLFRKHEKDDLKRFSLPTPWREDCITETGQVRVNQKSLIWLMTDPLVPKEAKDVILAYWKAGAVEKTRSTFVVSEGIERAIGEDGRLRVGWHSLGTETGRWSCSKPNIMTLSEEKD